MASRLALGRSRCRVLPSAAASSSLFASTWSPSLLLARPYSQLPLIPGGPALTEEQIAAHKAAERESSRKAMEFMEEQYQLELANARRKADQRPNSRLPQQQVSPENDTISDAEYRKTAAAPAAVAAVGSNPMAAAPVSPPFGATPAVPAAASTPAPPPAEPVVTPAVMKGHSMATAIPAGNATPPAAAPKPVVEQVVPPDPQSPPPPPPPHGPAFPRTRFAFKTAVVLALSGLGYTYYSDSSAAAHHLVVMPLIRAFVDAEDSHRLAINVLQWPVRPVDKGVDDPVLETDFFGHKMSSPLGLAAGFDKNAESIDGLFDLGFGYVEIGSVTPVPQPGNPKPRFFRLVEDQSCINRYGFNSDGHAEVLHNLRKRVYNFYHRYPSLYQPSSTSTHPVPPAGLPRSLIPGKLLGVNLGKNKTSDAASDDDYVRGVRTFGQYADVLVINVSSPNTPGLRNLQGGTRLGELLKGVVEERNRLQTVDGVLPKLLVKVAPDLDSQELNDIAKAVKSSGIDGVIVSNTTISRPATLKSPNKGEVGGLSGPPAKPLALKALSALRAQLPSSIPLIGCGGITTGQDALEFAQAGASAFQLYTSFGFRGVGTPRFIKDELAEALKRESTTWKQVAGGKKQ